MERKLHPVHLTLVTLLSIGAGLALKAKYGGDWFEFAGFVTGVVGVYLVAVEHIVNWPVGLANVAIYAWVFFTSRLYADMTLQFFFFALGVHGWWSWARGSEENTALKISRIPKIGWLWIALILAVGTAIYTPIITHFKGAAPLVDSLLTVASIVAQVLLNRKKIENWILWIAVDAVYIPLYVSRNLVATAVLYGLLLILAVSGLLNWMRLSRNQQPQS